MTDGVGFRAFLESYRRLISRRGRVAELVLLTGDISADARQRSIDSGATVLDVDADFADYGCKNRHWYMAHYLAGAREFDYAITLDARDSILQENPFAAPPMTEPEDFVALSSEGRRVGECFWNVQNAVEFHASLRRPWHEYDYRHYWILNGSLAAGSVPRLAGLVLARAGLDLRDDRCTDQGSYTALGNWLAEWPGYRIVGPELPLVFHGSAYGYVDGVTIDATGTARDPRGRPYAIFHQWDRTPFAELVLQQYCSTG